MAALAKRVKDQEHPTQVAAAFLNAFESNAWFAYKVSTADSVIELFSPLIGEWVMEKPAERAQYLEACNMAIGAENEKRAKIAGA
jgi:hypothetical protein